MLVTSKEVVVAVQECSLSRTASDDVGIEMLRVVLFPYFASTLISQKPKVAVLGK